MFSHLLNRLKLLNHYAPKLPVASRYTVILFRNVSSGIKFHCKVLSGEGFYKQYFIYLIIYINTTTNKQKYRTKFRGISVQNPFPGTKFYFLKWDFSRIDNEFLFLGLHCSESPKTVSSKGHAR